MIDKIKEELMNNNLELALELILENDEKYKNNISFINIKGILALKVGEYKTAISNLEYAIELIEKNKVLYNIEQNNTLEIDISCNLALAYEKNGDVDKAYTVYKYILNNTNSEEDKLEFTKTINRIKNSSKEQIEQKYGVNNIINENEYGKIRINDISYKETPSIGNDIYEVRQRLNNLREDENPLVSIYVLAYNNLEKYTKKCIESILKYSSDIDYELILVDNGSNDGTDKYFENINYHKKKIIKITKNVGAGFYAIDIFKETKGKYIAFICNDVIVTKNWLSNLVKCMESDFKIGMATPVSDFVSNLQGIDLGYTDLDDMQKKAAEYNISDPKKWYERLKLITLGTLFRKEAIDMIGTWDYGYIHHYADDDITFRVRRAGYKTILCKDTFVSHIGSSSSKGKEIENIGMKKGKVFFEQKYYGVKAEDAMNYEYNLLSIMDKNISNENCEILGIDTLCGTPILELKNILNENKNSNLKLSAFSTDARYWLDLKTICEDVVVDRIDYILEHYKQKFDYILLGKALNLYQNPYKVINDLIKIIDDRGNILLKLKNNYNFKSLLSILNGNVDLENQGVQNLDINLLNHYLTERGFYISEIKAEVNYIDDADKACIKNSLVNVKNYDEIIKRASIENYLISIKKQ